jgi:hypothetical protein
MSFFTSVKVTDGTNIAAVKAASTASVLTDPSLVVALSSNSPLPALGTVAVNSQTWTTGVGGTDAKVTVTGYNSVIVTLNGSGTISTGVATYEVSDDGGTTWFSIGGKTPGGASFQATSTLAASLVTLQFNVAGYTTFRARNSTTITGAAGQSIVRVQASAAAVPPGQLSVSLASETTKVIGTIRIIGNLGVALDAVLGATKPANVLQVGGNDGTNAYAIPLASGGGKVLVTADAITIAATQTLATVTTVGTVTTVTNPVKTQPASPTTAAWTAAAITFSSSGANTIVAGVGGQTIRVMRIFFVNSDVTTATNITIGDTTVTNFSGAFLLQSGGSFNGAASGEPLYVTASGKGFQLNSSAAVQISGTVWYTIS